MRHGRSAGSGAQARWSGRLTGRLGRAHGRLTDEQTEPGFAVLTGGPIPADFLLDRPANARPAPARPTPGPDPAEPGAAPEHRPQAQRRAELGRADKRERAQLRREGRDARRATRKAERDARALEQDARQKERAARAASRRSD